MLRYRGAVAVHDAVNQELFAWPWGFRVLLDGEEQRYVDYLDTEAGRLTRIRVDERGHPLTINDGADYATETVEGRVEVVLGDPDDPFEPPDEILRAEAPPAAPAEPMRQIVEGLREVARALQIPQRLLFPETHYASGGIVGSRSPGDPQVVLEQHLVEYPIEYPVEHRELRVGDHVVVNDQPARIVEVTENGRGEVRFDLMSVCGERSGVQFQIAANDLMRDTMLYDQSHVNFQLEDVTAENLERVILGDAGESSR